MRKLIIALFILLACKAHAQYIPNSGAYSYKGLKQLNSLQPPSSPGMPVTATNAPDSNYSALYYNKTDTTWYQFNPVSKQWSPFSSTIGIGHSDTVLIHSIDSLFITSTDSIFIISGNDTIYVGNSAAGMDTAYSRNDSIFGVKSGGEFLISQVQQHIDSLYITNSDSVFIITNNNDTVYIGNLDLTRNYLFAGAGTTGGYFQVGGNDQTFDVDTIAQVATKWDLTQLGVGTGQQPADSLGALTTFYVDSLTHAPEGSPATGHSVLPVPTTTGGFVTHDNNPAQWNGSSYAYTVPGNGNTLTTLFSSALNEKEAIYQYDSAQNVWKLISYPALNRLNYQLAQLRIGTKYAYPFTFATRGITRDSIDKNGNWYNLKLIGSPANNYLKVDSATGRYEIDTTIDLTVDGVTITGTGRPTDPLVAHTSGSSGIALTDLSATSPLAYNNSTGVFSIQQANTSQGGYLSSTDWNTFNNKLGSYTETDPLALKIASNLSDVANTATARNNILPSQTGNGTKFLQTDGTNVSWATPSGGSGNVFDSLGWFNVKWWNISPANSEATNTANWNTFISAMQLVYQSVTAYFPRGDSAYKIRMVIPTKDPFSIRIMGATAPIPYYGTIGSFTLPTKGVILQSSDVTSGNSVIQVTGAINLLSLENLDIRTNDSTRIGGVDAHSSANLLMRNCIVNTNIYNVLAKAPALTNTYGVRTPQASTGSLIELDNVAITGFYTGLECNEHTVAINTNILSCVHAITINNAEHNITILRPALQRNTYNIYFNPTVTGGGGAAKGDVDIRDATMEHVGVGQYTANTAWQQTIADVLDSTNMGTGAITWRTALGGSGADSSFTMSGGSRLQTGSHGFPNYLKYPLNITTNGSPLTISTNYTSNAQVKITNSSSSATATAGFTGFNNNSIGGGLAVASSAYTYTGLRNNTYVSADSALLLISNANGVNLKPIDFITGGLNGSYTMEVSGNNVYTVAGGKVGIGLSSPQSPLSIKSNYNGNYGQFDIQQTTGNGNASIVYMSMHDAAGTRLSTEGFGHFGGGTDPYYYWSNEVASGGYKFRNSSADIFTIDNSGKTFIGGSTTPTARLHIAAGTATANTAPLKLIAGTNLTTPENGAIEYDGTNLYLTVSSTRYLLTKTLTGTAAPTTTPVAVGDHFIDTTNKKEYVATGTSSSADWTILN